MFWALTWIALVNGTWFILRVMSHKLASCHFMRWYCSWVRCFEWQPNTHPRLSKPEVGEKWTVITSICKQLCTHKTAFLISTCPVEERSHKLQLTEHGHSKDHIMYEIQQMWLRANKSFVRMTTTETAAHEMHCARHVQPKKTNLGSTVILKALTFWAGIPIFCAGIPIFVIPCLCPSARERILLRIRPQDVWLSESLLSDACFRQQDSSQ